MAALLKWSLLLPVAVLAVMLAIANRTPVELAFDPFGASDLHVTAPLFIVAFASMMIGVVIGGVAVWMRQGRHRRAAREARSQARRLEAEGDRLRARTSSLTALLAPGMGADSRAA
jgi:uncharacterized integral membrane protein